MFGKNPFRTFLYVVVFIVLAKLCYNLGNRLVSKMSGAASETTPPKTRTSREAEGLRGLNVDPADSTEAAQATPPAR